MAQYLRNGLLPVYLFHESGAVVDSSSGSSGLNCVGDGRWSPGGRTLAFPATGGATGGWDIFVETVPNPGETAGALTNLTHSPGEDEMAASWSPDGGQLVYVKAFLDGAGRARQELYLIDVVSPTAGPRGWTDTADEFETGPVWISASEIAYLSWSPEESAWYLKTLSTTEPDQGPVDVLKLPDAWYRAPAATETPPQEPTGEPAAEPTEAAIAAATLTATPLPTPPTMPPTPPPYPTVPPDQRPGFLSDLFASNGGCDLPCWWGITPGVSRWEAHAPFLENFADVTQRSTPANPGYDALVRLPQNEADPLAVVYGASFGVNNGVVEHIQTGGASDVPSLRLPAFLAANGPPDEIWVSTFSSVLQGGPPFRLLLIYSEGIAATFEIAEASIVNEKLVGCFQPPYRMNLFLVAPDRQLALTELREAGRLTEDHPYLPLEEATGMDGETFFEAFGDPDSNLCLESPQELWP